MRWIRQLLVDLEFPVRRDVGVTEAHVDDLTSGRLADFFITQSPVAWTAAEVRTVFQSGLAMESRTLDRRLAWGVTVMTAEDERHAALQQRVTALRASAACRHHIAVCVKCALPLRTTGATPKTRDEGDDLCRFRIM
jgi:hypothetical protein